MPFSSVIGVLLRISVPSCVLCVWLSNCAFPLVRRARRNASIDNLNRARVFFARMQHPGRDRLKILAELRSATPVAAPSEHGIGRRREVHRGIGVDVRIRRRRRCRRSARAREAAQLNASSARTAAKRSFIRYPRRRRAPAAKFRTGNRRCDGRRRIPRAEPSRPRSRMRSATTRAPMSRSYSSRRPQSR